MQEVQNKAIKTYNTNMDFFKTHNPELYEQIKLFDLALNLEEIKSNLELEYKDNKYFDILDVNNSEYFYNENSIEYSKRIIKNTNNDLTISSFKSFMEYSFSQDIVEKSKLYSPLSSPLLYNSSIINYVDENSPKDRFCKDIYCYMIFGVGLGLHIPLIANKLKPKLLYIVEPSLETFRLSLFVTEYFKLNDNCRLIFSIAENKKIFYEKFASFFRQAYMYNHYLKFFLFSNNCNVYLESIQVALTSQPHMLFTYDRKLKSFMRTITYLKQNYKFFDVKENYQKSSLEDKPVLILAAGPSLHKNLNFIRENQGKFIIMALFSMCPMLEKEGIDPDIITNYDEARDVFINTYNEIKDKKYFDNKILLFGSHVNEELVSLLPKDNVYFFQAMSEIKKGYSFLSSPSIGEMTYALALIFNPKEIYLIGLDFAFDQDTGKSHSEGYFDSGQFEADKEASLEKFSFRKNVIKVKGNFREIVETMPVFNISIKAFNGLTKTFNKDNHIPVYNLSDGAYFENTTPINGKDVDVKSLVDINKSFISQYLKDFMKSHSSSSLDSYDTDILAKELESCKVLKEDLTQLLSNQKHSSVVKYHQSINQYNITLSLTKYECKDLIKILFDYNRYTLPYIIYLLNMKGLNNPKAHIKKLNKLFVEKVIKIIDLYSTQLEELLKK